MIVPDQPTEQSLAKVLNAIARPRIEPLPHAEHCGDWHDKPLRWKVTIGPEIQKFSTQKEAKLWVSIRRTSASFTEATRRFIDA